MRAMLVIPRDEQSQFVSKSIASYRDQQTPCSLTLHRPDESLNDGDAAVLSNGAISRLDLSATAPDLKSIAPELDTFVADYVFRRGPDDPDRSSEKRADC